MPASRRVAPLAIALALMAGAGAGQPRTRAPQAYETSLAGPAPVTGLGASIPVQIVDAGDHAAVLDARVSAVRLLSPFGAVTPLPPPPDGALAPGLRLFHADLTVPGAWTLEFTVTRPGRPPAQASLGFDVLPTAMAALPTDPMAASFAPAEPVGGGGGAAGGASASIPTSARAGLAGGASTGYSPEAAPFCATCAAEAPH